jgi:hypothetical protein
MRRWFNVRETRAEAGGAANPGAKGRMLSWRPLSEREAKDLLTGRLSTLEALGYAVDGADEGAAEPWDWLRRLTHRAVPGDAEPTQDSRSSAPKPEASPADLVMTEEGIVTVEDDGATAAEESAPSDTASAAVESIDRRPTPEAEGPQPAPEDPRSNEPAAVLAAMAAKVGVDPARFAFPSVDDTRRADPEALADALDQLAESEVDPLLAVAERWLTLPTTAYELDRGRVERWLLDGRHPGRWLATRLPREGLALIGPEGLRRLQQTSRSPRVRSYAHRWVERLYPTRR